MNKVCSLPSGVSSAPSLCLAYMTLWKYRIYPSIIEGRQKEQCLKSSHFPCRSKSSVYGIDEEEKRHSAAHAGVLPHLHPLHHSAALHYEAAESTRDMEEG